MKLRTYTSLFIAIFVYTISIIIGLIKGFPLFDIFIKGIIVTIITAILVWIIVFLLEFLSDEDSNKNTDKRNNKRDRNKESSTDANSNAEDSNQQVKGVDEEEVNRNAGDFSPLTPPVLEVAQQELERGEGN